MIDSKVRLAKSLLLTSYLQIMPFNVQIASLNTSQLLTSRLYAAAIRAEKDLASFTEVSIKYGIILADYMPRSSQVAMRPEFS